MSKNPLTLDSLHPVEDVAGAIVRLWRSGSRQPRLLRQLGYLHHNLTLDEYNAAAEVAWSMLTDNERTFAIAEAKERKGCTERHDPPRHRQVHGG